MISEYISNNRFLVSFFIFFTDIINYIYVLVKLYRILCFSKITFDQLLVVSRHKWPLSFLRIVTRPFFKFWHNLMPSLELGPIKLGKKSSSLDFSLLIGLEMLNMILSALLQLKAFSLSLTQKGI